MKFVSFCQVQKIGPMIFETEALNKYVTRPLFSQVRSDPFRSKLSITVIYQRSWTIHLMQTIQRKNENIFKQMDVRFSSRKC